MIPTLERTSRESVFFPAPFLIEGAGEQASGAYTIEIIDTLIEELSFLAYRRTATSIMLPLHAGGSSYQLLPIDPMAVAAARKQALESGRREMAIGQAERTRGKRDV